MTIQELSDHVGERIMCPHVATMERAHIAELRAREPVYVGRTDPGLPRLAPGERRVVLVDKWAGMTITAVGRDPYVWHDTSDFDPR